MRRFRRRLTTATAVVIFGVVAAACGEQVVTHVEASSTVHAALTGVFTSPTTQFSITVHNLPNESPADSDVSIVVTTSRLGGQDTAGPYGNHAVDVSVERSGSTMLDVRYVGSAVYLRVDIGELAQFGGSGSLAATVASLDEMAARPGLGYIHALVLGEWVGVSASTLKAFTGALAREIPSTGQSAINSQRVARLQTAVTTSLAQSLRAWLSVHQVSADEYALSLPVRRFVASFAHSIAQPLQADLNEPFLSGQALSEAVDKIPANLFVHLNVWVKDGSMSKIQIFIPDSKGSVLIGISHPAASVQAPSGATMVTAAGLTDLFGASLMPGLALKAAAAGVDSPVNA